jgi:hypothetical protein
MLPKSNNECDEIQIFSQGFNLEWIIDIIVDV